MAIFPQVNTRNYMMVQTPFGESQEYATILQPVQTGMMWAFGTRGAGLSGYPTGPLSRFAVAYSNITDAEINTLYSFFQSVKGSYGSFAFLDPSGNLLQYSELFSNAYWTKTSSITPGQPDPLGYGNRASTATAGYIEAVVGPSAGGMSGFVLCASIYVKPAANNTTVTLGFIDNTTSIQYTKATVLNAGGYSRLFYTLLVPTNNQFLFYCNFGGTCNIFGAQVGPQKGEGAYVLTPGNYGYHANCRFDVDEFVTTSIGPNQNQLSLPIVEFNT